MRRTKQQLEDENAQLRARVAALEEQRDALIKALADRPAQQFLPVPYRPWWDTRPLFDGPVWITPQVINPSPMPEFTITCGSGS